MWTARFWDILLDMTELCTREKKHELQTFSDILNCNHMSIFKCVIHLLFLVFLWWFILKLSQKYWNIVFPILKDYMGWQHCEGQACLSTFVSPAGKRNLFIYFLSMIELSSSDFQTWSYHLNKNKNSLVGIVKEQSMIKSVGYLTSTDKTLSKCLVGFRVAFWANS